EGGDPEQRWVAVDPAWGAEGRRPVDDGLPGHRDEVQLLRHGRRRNDQHDGRVPGSEPRDRGWDRRREADLHGDQDAARGSRDRLIDENRAGGRGSANADPRPTDPGDEMAQQSEVPVAPVTTTANLGRLQRLPVRRLIQIVLAILIVAFVALGSYKTLTLPQADRSSASAWKAFV